MNGDLAQFEGLPHFVGEGANVYAASLIKILSQKPALFRNIQYIMRLGNRRWNFILKNGITVKMPEDNFQNALEYLNTKYSMNNTVYFIINIIIILYNVALKLYNNKAIKACDLII